MTKKQLFEKQLYVEIDEENNCFFRLKGYNGNFSSNKY